MKEERELFSLGGISLAFFLNLAAFRVVAYNFLQGSLSFAVWAFFLTEFLTVLLLDLILVVLHWRIAQSGHFSLDHLLL